jgi:hypothetical protein
MRIHVLGEEVVGIAGVARSFGKNVVGLAGIGRCLGKNVVGIAGIGRGFGKNVVGNTGFRSNVSHNTALGGSIVLRKARIRQHGYGRGIHVVGIFLFLFEAEIFEVRL